MEKFPEFIERPHRSPGARWQRRAGGERPGAHAEARAERRRNVAEKIAATGTAAVSGSGSGDIGAEPVTAGCALRIDALHRKAGQIFHFLSILGAGRRCERFAAATRKSSELPRGDQIPGGKSTRKILLKKNAQGKQTLWPELCRERPVVSREKATRYCGKVARVGTPDR